MGKSRPVTPGRLGGPCSPPFTPPPPKPKIKSKSKEKKEKSFKEETIKRLSSKSKCYCFNHSRTSRIQKFFLSTNHGGRLFSVPWLLHFEIAFAHSLKYYIRRSTKLYFRTLFV